MPTWWWLDNKWDTLCGHAESRKFCAIKRLTRKRQKSQACARSKKISWACRKLALIPQGNFNWTGRTSREITALLVCMCVSNIQKKPDEKIEEVCVYIYDGVCIWSKTTSDRVVAILGVSSYVNVSWDSRIARFNVDRIRSRIMRHGMTKWKMRPDVTADSRTMLFCQFPKTP